jgi:acetyl-CoA synthetase
MGTTPPKFTGLIEKVERIAVGEAPQGWRGYDALLSGVARFAPDGPTRADDPMLLYFTSGTTARAKLVVHTHASYPIGHLTTMYGLGLKPGDAHLNISSPGWAKHVWSSVFAPWNAAAYVVALAGRFEPRAALDALVEHNVTTFCAPPTVWRMLIQHDLTKWKLALREVASAGEPLNPEVIEQVRRAWGLTPRDTYGQTETTMVIGNSPAQKVIAGSMGRALPGYRIVLLDADERPRRDRAAASASAGGLDARLSERGGRAGADRGRLLSHRRCRLARLRRLFYLPRPRRRCVQIE